MARPKKPLLELDPARNLLEIIASNLLNFRKSDRKVAELTLANPQFVMGATVAETSRRAGVSEPTVMRFCETLGCTGFPHFKMRLAQSVALGMPATHSVLMPEDSTQRITDKIFDYNLNTLSWARKQLDIASLDAAINILLKARKIEFFGFGASRIIAEDAQQKFPLFAVPCVVNSDAHQQFIAAAMMRRGDVAVLISNTGRTRSILEVARLAKSNGAKTIGITGSRSSPLLTYCEIGIIVETLENTDIHTPTISRIAGLIVIDILATAIAFRRGSGHQKRLARMKEQLVVMRIGQESSSINNVTDDHSVGVSDL
jgi:RpiR family transcriptional regulator, carbohydrate utilization regulator